MIRYCEIHIFSPLIEIKQDDRTLGICTVKGCLFEKRIEYCPKITERQTRLQNSN